VIGILNEKILLIEEGIDGENVISAPMNTADQTAKAGCRASTTFFLWLYWRDTPPVQYDQLCSIGADMTSATSLSLSICNLLLYDPSIRTTLQQNKILIVSQNFFQNLVLVLQI